MRDGVAPSLGLAKPQRGRDLLTRVAAFSVLLGLSVGCPPKGGPGPQPPPPPVEKDESTSPLGDDVLVHAKGEGATEDEAYAVATAALAEALLGDPSWAQWVQLQVHRRGTDPQRGDPGEGGMVMHVGLSRARAAEVISDFENSEPPVTGPEVWRDTLQTYLRAHVAAHACVRRTMLFSSRCETGDLVEIDAAVGELSQGLLLVPAYTDGVPVDAGGVPLRTPVVFTLWRGVPLAGLPLQIDTTAEGVVTEPRIVSDAQGRIEIGLTEGLPLPSMKVQIDAQALLGPQHPSAPQAELSIEPRSVGVSRWALLVTRQGSARKDDEAGTVLRDKMKAAGLGVPVSLNDRDATKLRKAAVGDRGARLADIADAMSGRIDLLLMLSYKTRFASRMGGGRIWYEAEGTLTALDAWTGQVKAQATDTVGADGVGDDQADRAAREKLGESLSTQVMDALRR